MTSTKVIEPSEVFTLLEEQDMTTDQLKDFCWSTSAGPTMREHGNVVHQSTNHHNTSSDAVATKMIGFRSASPKRHKSPANGTTTPRSEIKSTMTTTTTTTSELFRTFFLLNRQ